MSLTGSSNAVAQARVYFAVRTREAELGALTELEVRRTALARAREMVDYQIFRDMMRDNAPDYEPSSKTTRMFFAAMQNKLYVHVVGMTAVEIRHARTLQTWPGIEEGRPEPSLKSAARKVAKNYLTGLELRKLDQLVGRLCLRAEDIAEDGLHLSLSQWRNLVEAELVMANRQIAA
ncbi:RhuM family protein [Streptomyces sp. NPDC058457]|uniref:RhuM family protein n=1 Tax=Streptomyces sp. NPDC058457 TaxID=3346507 RepID=UPI00364AC018